MSPLPYLPPGSTSTPAERFLLFADTAHDVMRLDESVLTKDSSSFSGYWESPPLAGKDAGTEFTLTHLELLYVTATATTIIVRVSCDGGETWNENQTLSLQAVTKKMSRIMADFNTTGFDLRARIEFPTEIPVNVYGIRPTLVDRGELIL